MANTPFVLNSFILGFFFLVLVLSEPVFPFLMRKGIYDSDIILYSSTGCCTSLYHAAHPRHSIHALLVSQLMIIIDCRLALSIMRPK
jgi:hypothetical protein